jgi:hypothetical protein
MLDGMIPRPQFKGLVVLAALLPFTLSACHKEEQVVKGVEQKAVNAEQKAQATASQLDQERAQLAQIPLPTKSLYVDVREPSQWANPFLSVGPETVTLRILRADANPSPAGKGTLLRPEAARSQQLELRLTDLEKAVTAIPAGAWPYGRVIAVAESPDALPKDRPAVRRNLEAVMRQLNDLGIVAEEWPSK